MRTISKSCCPKYMKEDRLNLAPSYRRLQKIKEVEQHQAQREMMLQVKEAIDISQLEEMNLSRSLALDNREKVLHQREIDQKEAVATTLSR